MTVERLYEYWDELYNRYGSYLQDVYCEHELTADIAYAKANGVENIWEAVFPSLLAAEDELSAETLDLMEGCYGRE